MKHRRYIQSYLGWDYGSYNSGKSKRQATRNRRLGTHIIRQRQKRELERIKGELYV